MQDEAIPDRARQRRALGLLALVALAALVRLALPVGVGLLLGALVAFTLQPLYEKLRRWLRPGPAALACSLAATTLVSAMVAVFGALLVTRGLVLLGSVPPMLEPGGQLREAVLRATTRLAALHVDVGRVAERLRSEAMVLAARAGSLAAEVAGATLSMLLALLFMALTAFFVLRNWGSLAKRAEQLLPFDPRHTRALLDQLRAAGRQVLFGTVVTGLVQGVLSAVGYWVTGVPEPAFFGALTAMASLVPVFGTALVWLLVGVVEVLSGRVVAGLVELAYGAIVVSAFSEYVLRPRLVGGETNVPTLLMFVALLGGAQVFGIVGLILGPVIVTLSVAVLRTYAREATGASGALMGRRAPGARARRPPERWVRRRSERPPRVVTEAHRRE